MTIKGYVPSFLRHHRAEPIDPYHRTLEMRPLELWDFGVPVDSLDWTRLPQ
jgi:hypothetical protein